MGLLATLTGFRLLRFLLRVVMLLVLAIVVYLLVTMVQVWLVSRRYEPRPAGAIVVMGTSPARPSQRQVPPKAWPARPRRRGSRPR